MDVFWTIIQFVGALFVLGLALVGVLGLVAALGGDDQRAAARRARLAEEHIAEMGRQAQIAILGEALRRAANAGSRRGTEHGFRPQPMSGDEPR